MFIKMDRKDARQVLSQGARQAKLEMARNLLQFGLSVENIAQATGLTKAEAEALG